MTQDGGGADGNTWEEMSYCEDASPAGVGLLLDPSRAEVRSISIGADEKPGG